MTRSLSATRPLAAGLAALALTLDLGLAGCTVPGGEEPPAPSTPSTSSGAEEDTAPGDGGTTGDAAGRPSQEEVAAGLSAVVAEMAPGVGEASQDVLDHLATCAVGRIYDSASADSLRAMADGDLAGADPDDLTALSNAVSACSTELDPG